MKNALKLTTPRTLEEAGLQMKKNMSIEEFPIQTVYANQVSNLPPIRYCLEVIINSISFAFFKKN